MRELTEPAHGSAVLLWSGGQCVCSNVVASGTLKHAKRVAMATGTVKWFNETKGYGFIQPDQGGKDVFVHISAVERSGMRGLAEGMKVSYDVEADRRTGKESATNLKAV